MSDKKHASKKKIPKPSFVQIGRDSDGNRKIVSKFKDYAFEEEKKDVEEKVLLGFIRSIQNRNISLVDDKRKEKEYPDFICKEGRKEFGIELMELLTINEKKDRQITGAVQKKINKPALYINVQPKNWKTIPKLDSREWNSLIDEIANVISYADGQGGKIDGDLLPTHFNLGFAYHTEHGILGKVTNTVYFSTKASIGVQLTPTDQDYSDIQSNLTPKWFIDYGMECWLLIYTFGVEPEYERLLKIIQTINSQSGIKFDEIWFTNPGSLDEQYYKVKNLYSR